MKKRTPTPHTVAIAACTFELQANSDTAIQLFPAGAFRALDGRPADAPHWFIDAVIAAQVMAGAAARKNALVIDYEHQTLNSATNGQPAPAAGWVQGTDLEWREGVGLFATQPQWTEPARGFIARREYRYVSPVFTYDTTTGAVLRLLHIAITNDPGIDGMQDLLSLAAARFQLADPAAPSEKETQSVNREQLIGLLGLANDASDEDIQNALNNLKDSADLVPQLQQDLASAKAATPDPTKYVSVDVVEDLKKDVAALKNIQITSEVNDLVSTGLAEGRLLPAQESWARELGSKDVAALKSYLEKTPAIAALKGQQSRGVAPVPTTAEELSPEALAVCKQMGLSAADYLATLKGESQ